MEISLKRIAERVARGGHHIPEQVARRRFHRGIENLFKRYQTLASSWIIFDNSGAETETIAYGEEGKEMTILKNESFAKIKKAAGLS